MIRLRNMDRPGSSSCSLRHNKSPRTSPNDQGNRNSASEPTVLKTAFFSFRGHPVDSPERSTQAAPRTADSMGTCLAGPIILNKPSGRGSLHFQSRRSKKFLFSKKIGFDQKTSWIDVLHALLHPDSGCRAQE